VNKKRTPISAGGIAGLFGVTGGLAVAATTTTSPKAAYWEQTNSNINMSVTGRTPRSRPWLPPPVAGPACGPEPGQFRTIRLWRLSDRRQGKAGPQRASHHDGAPAAERYPARSGGGRIRGIPELPLVRKVLAAAFRIATPSHDFTTVNLATATRTSHDHSHESRTQPPDAGSRVRRRSNRDDEARQRAGQQACDASSALGQLAATSGQQPERSR
jgi:hypothetical protein